MMQELNQKKNNERIQLNIWSINDSLMEFKEDSYFIKHTLHAIIELLVDLKFTDNREFKKWLETGKMTYSKYADNHALTILDANTVKYYQYLLSELDKNNDIEFLQNHITTDIKYSKEHHPINKSNLIFYEELILKMIIAGQYENALSYCDDITQFSSTGLIVAVKDYLMKKRANEDCSKEIKKCKSILKKRHKAITNVPTDGLLYYLFYYKGLLQENNISDVVRAIFLGLE